MLDNKPRWLLHGHTHPTPGRIMDRIGDTRVAYINGARVVDLGVTGDRSFKADNPTITGKLPPSSLVRTAATLSDRSR